MCWYQCYVWLLMFSVDEGKEEEDMHARKKLNLTNNEAVDKVCVVIPALQGKAKSSNLNGLQYPYVKFTYISVFFVRYSN